MKILYLIPLALCALAFLLISISEKRGLDTHTTHHVYRERDPRGRHDKIIITGEIGAAQRSQRGDNPYGACNPVRISVSKDRKRTTVTLDNEQCDPEAVYQVTKWEHAASCPEFKDKEWREWLDHTSYINLG